MRYQITANNPAPPIPTKEFSFIYKQIVCDGEYAEAIAAAQALWRETGRPVTVTGENGQYWLYRIGAQGLANNRQGERYTEQLTA